MFSQFHYLRVALFLYCTSWDIQWTTYIFVFSYTRDDLPNLGGN